jgi:hypothetical protein
VLAQCCRAADRLEELRAAIAAAGPTVQTRQGTRENGLLKVELATRAYLTKTLDKLLNSGDRRPVGRPTDQALGPRSVLERLERCPRVKPWDV